MINTTNNYCKYDSSKANESYVDKSSNTFNNNMNSVCKRDLKKTIKVKDSKNIKKDKKNKKKIKKQKKLQKIK